MSIDSEVEPSGWQKWTPSYDLITTFGDEPPSTPPPQGYHRVVKTYDDLVPIVWADVPDGMEDPEPMYLSTSTAAIMMGTYDATRDPLLDDDDQGIIGQRGKHRQAQAVMKATCISIAMGVVLLIMGLIPWDGHPQAMPWAFLGVILVAMATVVTIMVRAFLPEREGDAKAPLLSWGKAGDQGNQSEKHPSTKQILKDRRVDGEHMAWLADRGYRQAQRLAECEADAHKVIDAMFERGSLSWMRFSESVDMMSETVMRNLDMVSERITDRGDRDEGDLVKDITAILDDNDTLLDETCRLVKELDKLKMDDVTASNAEVIADIRRLADETHCYASVD